MSRKSSPLIKNWSSGSRLAARGKMYHSQFRVCINLQVFSHYLIFLSLCVFSYSFGNMYFPLLTNDTSSSWQNCLFRTFRALCAHTIIALHMRQHWSFLLIACSKYRRAFLGHQSLFESLLTVSNYANIVYHQFYFKSQYKTIHIWWYVMMCFFCLQPRFFILDFSPFNKWTLYC